MTTPHTGPASAGTAVSAEVPAPEALELIKAAVLVPEYYASRAGQPQGHGPKFTARAVLAAFAEQGWTIVRAEADR